jgi:hypothetical protein
MQKLIQVNFHALQEVFYVRFIRDVSRQRQYSLVSSGSGRTSGHAASASSDSPGTGTVLISVLVAG